MVESRLLDRTSFPRPVAPCACADDRYSRHYTTTHRPTDDRILLFSPPRLAHHSSTPAPGPRNMSGPAPDGPITIEPPGIPAPHRPIKNGPPLAPTARLKAG